MRVLYLASGFPFPLTSGYLRQYFLIKELSARHEITLLSLVGPGFLSEHADALAPFTESVETFAAGRSARGRIGKALRRLGSVWSRDAAVEAMAEAVARREAEAPFDVVITGKRTASAVDRVPQLPVVADLCDATSARIRRSMRFASPVRLPFLFLELAQMRRAERALAERADRNVFISSRDREDLSLPGNLESPIVPNGVDLEFWRRHSDTLGRKTLVFTGAMNYRPNTDAAMRLIGEVLPGVRARIPAARLLIVGRDPTPALVRAGGAPGVEVTGFVDDVRPYLERATVFAAPIRFGAGMQNKVLEALAMEVPVVASPLAADGLRTEEGELPPLAVEGSTEEFIARTVELLESAEADPAPHASGRAFIERNYTWTASGKRLERVLIEAVGARRSERTV